jgi:hypothetical protein
MFGHCCFVRALTLVLFISSWLVLAKIECALHVALPKAARKLVSTGTDKQATGTMRLLS